MRIPLKIISQEIMDAYNLATLVDNQGWIHMRIEKGMYGIKQAGIIANQESVKIWLHLGIILCNTHLVYGFMTTETPHLSLWSTIFVFNIP